MIRILILSLTYWFSNLSLAGAVNERWSIDLGSPFNQHPIINEDLIVAAPSDGSIKVFSAIDQSILWELPAGTVWDRGVTLIGEKLILCRRDSTIAAVEASTGNLLWNLDLGDLNCQREGLAQGNELLLPTTYVGPGLAAKSLTGAKLYSINLNTGSINWEFTSETYLLQTPSIDDQTIVIGGSYLDPTFTEDEGGPSYYYGLEQSNGTVKWRHTSTDGLPKTVYAANGVVAYIAYQDYIQALSLHSGKPIWRKDTENWVSAFLGVRDKLFFGSANTMVHAWDLETGTTNWRFNMPGASFEYLLVAPRLIDNQLWFISQKGEIFALDQTSGKVCFKGSTGVISRIDAEFSERYIAIGDHEGKLWLFDTPKNVSKSCIE